MGCDIYSSKETIRNNAATASTDGIISKVTVPDGQVLSDETIRERLDDAIAGVFSGQKVLVLIPDHTRSLPLPLLFRILVEILHDTRRLDFLVALGTHPPLDRCQFNRLIGITEVERNSTFKHIGLYNHTWQSEQALTQIGVIKQDQVMAIAAENWHPSLGGDVPIKLNRAILDYDHILIVGPTYPHEVAGFSGGAKYLFPGISGPELIHKTHWMAALAGVNNTIGYQNTPVREMIHFAASSVPTPITLIALVIDDKDPAGIFIGEIVAAWRAAAVFSARRHITWYDKPFKRVLSCAPPMYDELWTAGKAVYKLDPVTADGGEIIIYAPHLKQVSRVHGKQLYQIGYHVMPYFLEQWQRFKNIPLGILAHSTHLRGDGYYKNGIEQARISVTLASQIPPQDCARLNLGYMDLSVIDIPSWINREDESILYVPKAGERLYRSRDPKDEQQIP
jgi:nickel-dependent lactate racemase